MTASVLRAHAAHLPLPDASVDLIVTSPPYFGLRSYLDTRYCAKCADMRENGRDPKQAWPDYQAHWDRDHKPLPYAGQIGSEGTPGEWLDALWACTAEWVRVLKPEGSLFVNLGDKYHSGAPGPRTSPVAGMGRGNVASWNGERRHYDADVQPKSLLGLPWRYAIGCMDRLGLILRAEIIWCLSGGARIYARMPGGDRPIMLRDLVRHYRPENVQLWNGGRWTQVLGWNRSPDRDCALELELRTGERIGCTSGHRWPTQRGVIRADELRIGDVIPTVQLPEPDDPIDPIALGSGDIGWLVGLYLAEGSRSEKMLQFSGHTREVNRHDRLKRIASYYHGNATVYRTSENGATCNVSGAVLLGIIDHYIGRGRTAKSKRLRKAVWQRDNSFLIGLMHGYLEGDGHYDAKNDRWRLGFGANDELAADLRTIAARLGAKVSLRRCMHQYDGRKFPGWRGEWRWTRSVHLNAKRDGEVVAIRASRAREFYDVGVADEPHLFALASGVLTHNSKPNGLPESVTDRVRRAHEQVFHFTRLPRYYAAVDEIREPYEPGRRLRDASGDTRRYEPWMSGYINSPPNPLGKLPGSVWEIPSQPLTVAGVGGCGSFRGVPDGTAPAGDPRVVAAGCVHRLPPGPPPSRERSADDRPANRQACASPGRH